MVSHGGFRSQPRVANLTNVMEKHAVGPQPAYKTLKDSLIILVGSIVKKKWAFLYMYFAIFSVYV